MAAQKRTISGPGAADFLTAQGGEDLPGTSRSKGMGQTHDESTLTDARNLEPALESESDRNEAREGDDSQRTGGPRREEQLTGSQTGTIGGGGPNAHNPSPVRATGVDDPSAGKKENS